MLHLAPNIAETANAVWRQWEVVPHAGIILGSGLGGFAEEIDAAATIDYADLPHFPRVSAMGHAGKLVCGVVDDVPIVAFQGRFHLYEGHSAESAGLPVRLLKALGAKTLIVSNAAGGLNPQYAAGDVMLIDDQINLQFANPLIGVNDDGLGPRFPDMSSPYDCDLQRTAMAVAMREGFTLHRGVYASVLGPNYETRAEYRMLRRLGADAVGMSTVPETIVAVHAGMQVLGLSTITNVGSPDALTETSGHDVLNVAASAGAKLSALVRGVIQSL